jgi:hypothetical protein
MGVARIAQAYAASIPIELYAVRLKARSDRSEHGARRRELAEQKLAPRAVCGIRAISRRCDVLLHTETAARPGATSAAVEGHV